MLQQVLDAMRDKASEKNAAGKQRFGITGAEIWGVRMPDIRKIAKLYRPDHALALALWESGVHEARILATLVEDPQAVSQAQLESWVASLDSWDICDAFCTNLVRYTPFALEKTTAWVNRPETFVKRAGYVMIAVLAVHEKARPDAWFRPFFAIIQQGADDPRNFVKKAVNWALRQIGKRNPGLRQEARRVAEDLRRSGDSTAAWIARDALREFDRIDAREASKS